MDAPLTDDEGDPLVLVDVLPDPVAELAFKSVVERDRQERLHIALETALGALSEEQRAAVVERYYQGGKADARACGAALRELRRPAASKALRVFMRD